MSVAMKKFTGACQVKVLCPNQVFTCMMIMIRQICPFILHTYHYTSEFSFTKNQHPLWAYLANMIFVKKYTQPEFQPKNFTR